MVCRPHASIGGQLLQLWLGNFFFNPLPEFTPRPTTCSDEVITEDSFSPSKISPGLRCLILLLYPEHIKNLPPSNGIICMKGNCPKRGKKERTLNRRGIIVRAAEAVPLLLPPSLSRLLFSLSVIFLGAFQRDCTWKLVTKQHIHTFYTHEGSFKFGSYTRGLMID